MKTPLFQPATELPTYSQNIESLAEQAAMSARQGHYIEALALYRQIHKAMPEDLLTRYHIMMMLERLNMLDEAEDFLEESLQQAPDYPYFHIVNGLLLRRHKDYSGARDALLNISDECGIPLVLAYKYFELAHNYDALGQYDAAYDALTRAHHWRQQRNKERGLLFDPQSYIRDIIQSYETFSAPPPQTQTSKTSRHPGIHFMVGFPRSGTTLLHHILQAHPKLEVLSEFPALHETYDAFMKRYAGEKSIIQKLEEKDFTPFRDMYFTFLQKHRKLWPNKIYIDKLPLNMVHAGFIRRLFPGARFIVSLRHPCDCVISNLMQNYQPNAAMENMTKLRDIARLYDLAFKSFTTTSDLLSLPVHHVRYEDLITDYETQARAVCDFLGIKFSRRISSYLQETQKTQNINTPSYKQVVEPIYKTSQQRWIKYKSRFESERVTEILKPWTEKFGYA